MSGLEDQELRAVFDAKGRADGRPIATNANAVPIRRTLTLASALARKPLHEARILDLACQEGAYGIEAALAGAQVVGVEARPAHVARARNCARRAGVEAQLRIEEGDVRRLTVESYGRFDIVFMLGILYHLEAEDAATTIANIASLCDDLLVIDTHVALHRKTQFRFKERKYDGAYVREHGGKDSMAAKLARSQASIDNEFGFYFTADSLVRLLTDSGFAVVVEAHAPLDATKPTDRVTLAALKRPLHEVRTYPWIAGLSEEAIAQTVRPFLPQPPGGLRTRLAAAANLVLHPLGFSLSRR